MKINDNGTDRKMTAAEMATYKELSDAIEAEQAAVEAAAKAREDAKASARAKLAKVGLTDDEVAALLGA